MTLHHLYQWIGWACLIGAIIPAFLRGGWPERSAAAAMTIAWFGSAFAQNPNQMWGTQAGVMFIDMMLLALLITLALVSDRWWPMWASGFHGLGILLHLAVFLDQRIWGRAYFIAGSLFSFLTLLALFLGSIRRAPNKVSPT
jgi:hypothetical protein